MCLVICGQWKVCDTTKGDKSRDETIPKPTAEVKSEVHRRSHQEDPSTSAAASVSSDHRSVDRSATLPDPDQARNRREDSGLADASTTRHSIFEPHDPSHRRCRCTEWLTSDVPQLERLGFEPVAARVWAKYYAQGVIETDHLWNLIVQRSVLRPEQHRLFAEPEYAREIQTQVRMYREFMGLEPIPFSMVLRIFEIRQPDSEEPILIDSEGLETAFQTALLEERRPDEHLGPIPTTDPPRNRPSQTVMNFPRSESLARNPPLSDRKPRCEIEPLGDDPPSATTSQTLTAITGKTEPTACEEDIPDIVRYEEERD